MEENKYVGSYFDDFLQEEEILEETEAVAAKRIFVYQLEKELVKQKLTKTDLAKRIGTSRSAINRLFNPNIPSTLRSLGSVTRALGKHLRIDII